MRIPQRNNTLSSWIIRVSEILKRIIKLGSNYSDEAYDRTGVTLGLVKEIIRPSRDMLVKPPISRLTSFNLRGIVVAQ
jgi:hypothetical protein